MLIILIMIFTFDRKHEFQLFLGCDREQVASGRTGGTCFCRRHWISSKLGVTMTNVSIPSTGVVTDKDNFEKKIKSRLDGQLKIKCKECKA